MNFVVISDLSEICKLEGKFLQPIYLHTSQHPCNNNIHSIIGVDESCVYVIPFNCPELKSINCLPSDIRITSCITSDTKALQHLCPHINATDADACLYLHDSSFIDEKQLLKSVYLSWSRKHGNKSGLGAIIPLSIHIQYVTGLWKYYCKYITTYSPHGYKELLLQKSILGHFERNGIHVNSELLVAHWGKEYIKHVKDDLVYSEYNPFTSTGRPSNTWDHLNFSALNSKTGCRQTFTSRFGSDGVLVYLDYESYHFRLIGQALNYKFPENTNIHQYLGGDKSANFKKLYGGPSDEDRKTFKFWDEVDSFVNGIWNEHETYGKVKSLSDGRYFKSDIIDNLRPYTLFNYLIQNFETVRNMEMCSNIIDLFTSRASRSLLVMYIYDGIIIDMHKSEKGLLKPLIDIMNPDKFTYPVGVKAGYNLDDLKKIL